LVLISSKRDLVIFIFCLIILFLILSFLEIRAERRQKSVSKKRFATKLKVFTKRRTVQWFSNMRLLNYVTQIYQ
jgi:hypothetical protein